MHVGKTTDAGLQNGAVRRSLRSGSFRKHKFHFGRSKKQEETPYSDGEIIGGKVSDGASGVLGVDNCNEVGLRRQSAMIEVGRIGSWAVSFEKLLADPAGIHTFAEFLKKEFSYENISFWVACERYRRTMTDESKLKSLAKEIYQKHLAAGSLEPVNVDGHARQLVEDKLESPGSDLFQLAQKQIFDLMKFDCYSRFLKSSFYQECVLKEVAGEPLPYQGDDSLNPDTPHHYNHETEKNKENEDRRRKSLLPWHRTKSGKPKKGKGALKHGEKRDDGPSSLSDLNGSRSSVASTDIPVIQRQYSAPESSIITNGSGEQLQDPASLCRVHFPDQSSTVVSLKSGETISTCMSRVISRRGLSYSGYELYQMGTNKVMDLDKECMVLNGKEFRVEERVLCHVEFPALKKAVAVKAQPSLLLSETLWPLLLKYDYQLDNVVVYVSGMDNKVDLNQPSLKVDKYQLVIQPKNSKEAGLQLLGVNKQSTLSDTNTKVTGKLSHNGLLDVQDGSQVSFKEVPVTYAKLNGCVGSKPPIASRPPQHQRKDCEDMFDLWKKAQRNRLDDQRGTEINFELPEFLKTQPNDSKVGGGVVGVYPLHGRVSEPAPASRQRGDAPGKLTRLNSEVFPPGMVHRSSCDDNLLDDGILPSHAQAEEYFSTCCLGMGDYRSSPGPRSLQNLGEFLIPCKKVESWRPPLLRPSSHPTTTAVPQWCRKHTNAVSAPAVPNADTLLSLRNDATNGDVGTTAQSDVLNKSFSPSSVPPPADTSSSSIHGDMADYLPPSPLRPTLDKLTSSQVPLHLPSDPPPLPPKPRPLYRPVPLDLSHLSTVCNNSDEDKCALMRQSYSMEASISLGHTRQLHGDNSDPFKDRFSVSFV